MNAMFKLHGGSDIVLRTNLIAVKFEHVVYDDVSHQNEDSALSSYRLQRWWLVYIEIHFIRFNDTD